MDSYGWVLYKEGYALTAVDALTQAINETTDDTSAFPELSLIYYHLGAAYRLAGKLDLAKNAFNKSLRIDPTCALAIKELATLNKSTNMEPTTAATARPVSAR